MNSIIFQVTNYDITEGNSAVYQLQIHKMIYLYHSESLIVGIIVYYKYPTIIHKNGQNGQKK